MDFNDRLRIFFKQKGLTQKEVGEKLGYSSTHVNYYFTDRAPNWKFLLKLKNEYPDADLNYLAVGEELRENSQAEVKEPGVAYVKKSTKILEDIEAKITELKSVLTHS